jgi:carboxyl-terminal processing protease
MSGARAPRCGAVALAALCLLLSNVAPLRARELSPIDLVDLEVAYDTLTTMYYRRIDPQRLIDGARVGMVAYARGHGIADPYVPAHRAAGRYAHDLHVPGQQVAETLLRYPNRLDPHQLVYAAIAGEVAALNDPFTVFFTADQEAQFYHYLNPGSFGGIGVVLHPERATGRFLIEEVVPGGPAERAGLQPGDWIVAIDGVPTKDQPVDAIEQRLRGKVGTAVQVVYGRGEAGAAGSLQLVRANVTPPDAFARLLPNGIGYIKLTSYGANAAKELNQQLSRLDAQGARAYVLDLRENGGGYRDVAVAVTSKFVPRGPVVIVAARNGKRVTIESAGQTERKPLAVLVNGATASAAEITAGAIADAKTGVLVGTRTFGKGLVQQMVPLPDGAALKVTVERYYTAHGRDIDRKGIDPDVVVAQPEGSVAGDPQRDPQLARALTLLDATPATVPPSPR